MNPKPQRGKEKIREEIVRLYFEYEKAVEEWRERAKQYGGNRSINFQDFMFWLNNNYLQDL